MDPVRRVDWRTRATEVDLANREADIQAGVEAVRAAARICVDVQRTLVTSDTLEKKDKSPVTVADFASQAVVCTHLAGALPGDRVVGEEDAAELRSEENAALRAAVVERVSSQIEGGATEARVLDAIDLGGAPAQGDRYWTLDPIDGTKGFLRGEQYAVALGLIENGEVVLGILGCPNLGQGDGLGALFVGGREVPARVFALADDDQGVPIRVAAPASVAAARFCESVESGHSDQSQSQEIARRLGITTEPYRIDSQCKYAAVSRGDASIYLRLPTRKDYREKIWDHAAGKAVVEAAGGRVTDVDGRDLDFTTGRTLERNRGIIATSGAIHDAVLDAVRATLAS